MPVACVFCVCVERRSPDVDTAAAAANYSLTLHHSDDDDDGFDPTLHVWHPPPENPDLDEEKPDGLFTSVANKCTGAISILRLCTYDLPMVVLVLN